MIRSLGFVGRKFWMGSYGLGEVDVNGDCQVHEPVAYEVPADLRGDPMADEDEADDCLDFFDGDDIDDYLTYLVDEPAEPDHMIDPADAFKSVPKPTMRVGKTSRKDVRTLILRSHEHSHSWKAMNPVYRRHRRIARRTSASLVEATI